MMAGLGAVIVALWRGWTEEEPSARSSPSRTHRPATKRGCCPAPSPSARPASFSLATPATTSSRPAGSLALELVYLFVLFICVPMLGYSLNRINIEVLKSKKKGEQTEALKELVNDNVPIVLCILIVFAIPFMVWLPVFKPF